MQSCDELSLVVQVCSINSAMSTQESGPVFHGDHLRKVAFCPMPSLEALAFYTRREHAGWQWNQAWEPCLNLGKVSDTQ